MPVAFAFNGSFRSAKHRDRLRVQSNRTREPFPFVEIPFFARFGRAESYLNIRCRWQRVCVTLAKLQPARRGSRGYITHLFGCQFFASRSASREHVCQSLPQNKARPLVLGARCLDKSRSRRETTPLRPRVLPVYTDNLDPRCRSSTFAYFSRRRKFSTRSYASFPPLSCADRTKQR